MRKYAISKTICTAWILLLLFFSIGYTYAYFSAIDTVTSNATIHDVDVSWRDGNSLDSEISTLFVNPSTIAISSELKRGEYVKIEALDKTSTSRSIKLKMANFGSTGAYCRIKIDATYLTTNNVTKICDNEWVQLALANAQGGKTLITSNGWVYYNGYYYYGASTSSLTILGKNTGIDVADYIYLSPSSTADIYDAQIGVLITLETVQASHNAYKTVWGI